MSESKEMFTQVINIDVARRNERNGHRSKVLWFTGLPCSGKTTIANKVEEILFEKGVYTFILDGDHLRDGLNAGLGFSEVDRKENLRRAAEVAKLFMDSGVIVLCAFVSPSIKDRAMVKEIVGDDNFIEIFVDTPLDLCELRDVKGLYKKARFGEILNFTGIGAPYEIPPSPHLRITTENKSINDTAREIIDYLLPKISI